MRRARVDQDCEVCSLPISAGDEIRGANLGGGTMRWVHPACCPGHEPEPYLPPLSTPERKPRRSGGAQLAWAKRKLMLMRGQGWEGDDSAELRRLCAAYEAGER